MPAGSTEFLVLLNDEGSSDGLEGLTDVVRISQVVSARLAIVEGPAGEAETALRSRQDVAEVVVPGGTLTPATGLSPQERLFADAWSQRTSEASARGRAGEGLAWDAPGFAPPDPPESGD